MSRKLLIFFAYFAVVFAVDQLIKWIFLNGFSAKSSWVDLTLVFNKGVAFSMFAFLGEYLKIVQVALVAVLFGYFMGEKRVFCEHYVALGIIFGAGSSNIFDRFIHGGVVDYVFWHKWFNFAVFNFADVMIDLGILLVLVRTFLVRK